MKPSIALSFIILAFLTVAYFDKPEYYRLDDIKAEATIKPLTKEEQALARFYIKHQSPDPVTFARVTANKKRKKLTAAVAVVESNANPKAISHKGARGAWQVMPKDHGPVPAEIPAQADQFEQIMETLIRQQQGNLKSALRHYYGGPFYNHTAEAHQYAAKVMRVVGEVPA